MSSVVGVMLLTVAACVGWWLGNSPRREQQLGSADDISVILLAHVIDAVLLGVVVGNCLGKAVYRNVAADAS